MKILCVCDLVLNQKVMEPIKNLKKYGAKVIFLDDKEMQSPKAITTVMLKTEQEGADACPANPDVIEKVEDVDIIVVHASPINRDVLKNAKKLKYIAVLRSGIENINEKICKEKNIQIFNAPGRSAHAVADGTLALMLSEAKNIARGHKGVMDGEWIKTFRNMDYIHDLRKCTVGIIGIGQIGKKVIDRLKGFGCNIIVYDPFIHGEDVEKMGYIAVSFEELLKQSDFISLHLRLSEKTEKIIGNKELALMKKTAYFINSARAGLVDEEALVLALQEHRIGGAAMDVFNQEPLPQDSPFLQLDNVTLSPHVAGTSVDTFENSVEIIYEDLVNLFENKEIVNLIK